MVITGLIRNQFDGNVTWVRIPHPPPKLSEKSGISGLFSVIMHILRVYKGVSFDQTTKRSPSQVGVLLCNVITSYPKLPMGIT